MSLSLLDRLLPALRRRPAIPRRAPPLRAFVRDDGVHLYDADGTHLRTHAGGEDWVAPLAGENLALVLSGRVTHQLLVTDPGLPLHDADALLTWARHQFIHYHGAAAERWSLAAWGAGGLRGASAAHGVDLDALQKQCEATGVRLRAAHPWWAVLLQTLGRREPALAGSDPASLWIIESDHVIRLDCQQGRLLSIDQHWLASPDGAALAALHRERGDPGVRTFVTGYGMSTADQLPASMQPLASLTAARPAREHWHV